MPHGLVHHDDELPRGERFVPLLLAHQQRIYGLILSLVPDWNDADDLMQQATTVMWRKFDAFEPGTDFAAWAMAIARFEVMDFRKRKAISKLKFNNEAVAQIADRMSHVDPSADDRKAALRSCLAKLPPRDQQLVRLRYEAGATTQSVAEAVHRSTDAVYKALNRIRGQLLLCIRTTLSQGETR
ncbi:MAG: sigma-70 family RNA polymerase sigma factor [Planctomycetes bacterium]|nr:sigma-70 family RNA polymerase sigma factor [Planctomycetota bacterium]